MKKLISERIFLKKQNETQNDQFGILKISIHPRKLGVAVIGWVLPKWTKNVNRNGNANRSQTWERMLCLTHKRNANQNTARHDFSTIRNPRV